MELRSTSTGELMNEVNALTRELAQERALVRSWIEKAEATRAATEALLVLNQDQRAEIERLQRENGALARTYALAEEKLRERTEALEKIANTQGVLHSSWHVATARDALGRANCC